MANPFSRSLTSLDAERFRALKWTWLTAIALVAAWGVWFFAADVPVVVQSSSARLEVAGEVHRVGASLDGRVTVSKLTVDRRVAAGDVLVELDSSHTQVALEQARKRRAAIPPQIGAIDVELDVLTKSLSLGVKGREAALSEARARHRKARTSQRHTRLEVRRMAKLAKQGLVSDLEYQRARKELAELEAQSRTLDKSVDRVDMDRLQDESGRRARLQALTRERASLEARIVDVDAEIALLAHRIANSRVLAPIAGTLGDVAPVKPGTVMRAGEKLATIIPRGELKVVARFPARLALGRIRAGQPATLRLAGFPWSQYGTVSATVKSVAGEPVSGQVRVDLTLADTAPASIPLQHGQPAVAEVVVERVSPAILTLRAAGQLLSVEEEEGSVGPSRGAPNGPSSPNEAVR